MGYLITNAVNQIDAFKYRHDGKKILYYEKLKSNFTQMREDENISFFTLPYEENYQQYIENFNQIQNEFLQDNNYPVSHELDEIWFSCIPWFSFTGLVTPFRKSISIPQFIWDKYRKVDNQYYIHLMIMAHHGFVDGIHIAKFIHLLEESIHLWNSKKE